MKRLLVGLLCLPLLQSCSSEFWLMPAEASRTSGSQDNPAPKKPKKQWQRHLVCKDGSGNIVVDSTDLNGGPETTATSWHWRSRDEDTYHQISVPPHSCIYESHNTVLLEAPEKTR